MGAAVLALCALLACGSASARVAEARIQRVETAAATLEDVRVRLEWPEGQEHGRLRLRAAVLDVPLGYTLHGVDWNCRLQRAPFGHWSCDGPVLADGGGMDLTVALEQGDLLAVLDGDGTRAALSRDATTPDLWSIDLAGVPLAWLQQLLDTVWPEGVLTAGTGAAKLRLHAPEEGNPALAGELEFVDAGFDSSDGRLAGEELDARLDLEAGFGEHPAFSVAGELAGGGLLLGPAYLDLERRDIALAVDARSGPAGWELPAWRWDDPGILSVRGSALLPANGPPAVDLVLDVPALGPAGTHYLDGVLAVAGLGGMQLAGGASGSLSLGGGQLQGATLVLDDVYIADGRGRFGFDGVESDLRFSGAGLERGTLAWEGGSLHRVEFGASRLPLHSADGELWLAAPATVGLLRGEARLEHFRLRPPGAGRTMELRFGLGLEALDVGALAAALDWPAFTGELSGSIPQARYANDRLELAGGLEVGLFGGRVSASGLAMERPFGVAPTLSADVRLEDIDLAALTAVLDVGGVSGRLDGRIDGLRLLDWQPVAFDAWLETDPAHPDRRRISQRAVQDISSVGDASLVSSLQGQLIGFFDDFRYARIGIGCELRDEVCTMQGLRPAVNDGFVIVAGSGLPRLTVVGYNRRVDWPTLVERLAALGKGDVKPVVE